MIRHRFRNFSRRLPSEWLAAARPVLGRAWIHSDSSASNLGYGGNTSCVEISVPGAPSIVFDAGTGIHALGKAWMIPGAGRPLDLHLFLTHFHWDHICGIPFFPPLYQPDQKIIFHAPAHSGAAAAVLQGQMNSPYFPVNFEFASARKEFLASDEGGTALTA